MHLHGHLHIHSIWFKTKTRTFTRYFSHLSGVTLLPIFRSSLTWSSINSRGTTLYRNQNFYYFIICNITMKRLFVGENMLAIPFDIFLTNAIIFRHFYITKHFYVDHRSYFIFMYTTHNNSIYFFLLHFCSLLFSPFIYSLKWMHFKTHPSHTVLSNPSNPLSAMSEHEDQ